MEELMIKVENVSKEYRLGQIGGTTLRDELQRMRAKRRGQEDPTRKIGARTYQPGETFLALDGVSFEVKPGERIGIIGHNGAGKSTLLKLLSRVTAPTEGYIGLNGRIASMLEVGTGFHPELTGRENIYMNGAILGMTRREIDRKIEDIIDFSEVRQFIDTPVKRYSSGMYVKLAFSVAAHLDSEIMIMDEVLAVGDVAFQKKCLEKMSDVSKTEGRTILYVSHNMNTIRQLCDRVLVMDHGHIVFDGDVEEGIGIYTTSFFYLNYNRLDLSDQRMKHLGRTIRVKLTEIVLEKSEALYQMGDPIRFRLGLRAYEAVERVSLRMEIFTREGAPVGVSTAQDFAELKEPGDYAFDVELSVPGLVPAEYVVCMVLYEQGVRRGYHDLDAVYPTFPFRIEDYNNRLNIRWNNSTWGRIKFPDLKTEPKP